MKKVCTLLALVFFFTTGSLKAQNQAIANQIHLKSGTFVVQENLNEFLLNPYDAGELRNGHYVRIVHFKTLPTAQMRKEMLEAGLDLKSYVPDNSYLALFDSNLDLSLLESWNIDGVMIHKSRYKLSQELANKDYPAHAIENQQITLDVLMYPEMSSSFLNSAVASIRGVIINQNTDRGELIVRLPIKQIDDLAALPEFIFLSPINTEPESDNFRARTNHRTNFYQNGGEQLGGYDGSGVVVGVGDGGQLGGHLDYQNRFDNQYNTFAVSTHSSHVSGTILGAGNLDPNARGAAAGAFAYSYRYSQVIDSADAHYVKHAMRITNNSWGQGNTTTSCQGYNTGARFTDITIYNNPSLMHVFSSGNNGTNSCGYGVTGWGNITGGHKQAKNGIVVGNVSYTDGLAGSSSRGPARDGRLKPDVVGTGTSVYSTYPDNTYSTITGTSMSAPGVSGVLATMYQAYRDNHNQQDPISALIKACVLNGADDLGNAGPDFRFGYGRVNAKKAMDQLLGQQYYQDTLSTGNSESYTLQVPIGVGRLKVLLYWNDKEGASFALNPLVNDLQLELSDPSGAIFDPWVLDNTPNVTNLNLPATRGVDAINNTEQVTVDNPTPGTYTIDITGVSVPFGPQEYVVVYYFETNDEITVTYPNNGEALRPGSTETIRWDALTTSNSFTIDYTDDNGATWNNIGTASANQRYVNWNPSSTIGSDQVKIRVSRGGASDESDSTNSVFNVPTGFQVSSICPDSIYFTWDAVVGAAAYEILRLGTTHMESMGTFSTNSGAVLSHDPSKDYYYTIRTVGPNGGKGERRNAFFVPAGDINCDIDRDLSIEIRAPYDGPIPLCGSSSNFDLEVSLTNNGNQEVFGFNLSYKVDANPAVTELVNDTIPAGATWNYTFAQSSIAISTSPIEITAYHEYLDDQDKYNDTVVAHPIGYNSTIQLIPWSDNLSSFNTCGTSSNCGAEVCSLAGGWYNPENGVLDDIDWRTNTGSTPSSNTGPAQDINPGTASGRYLYLEASSCFESSGVLMTPCFDVPASGSFEFSFAYHMSGVNMGTLHVDIISDGKLYEDVISPIFGDQGSQWNYADFTLVPYAGQTISIRFRGQTGSSFESDISLDDFSIQAPTSAPVAGISTNANLVCPGSIIDFINTSSGAPSTFNWGVSPATGWSYVNGTNANSFNISVQFDSAGVYSVGLSVDNGIGSDSTFISSITIGGESLPFYEDFESANALDKFTITNPDNDYTWQRRAASGNTGSFAAGVNNYDYSTAANIEVEDWLTTPLFAYDGTSPIHVSFQHAYARYNPNSTDSMALFISTDCGESWQRIASFEEDGSGNFATVPSFLTSGFTPSSSDEWCGTTPICSDFDLSSFFSGPSDFQIRFVAKSGYGNNLYVDNINIGPPLPALDIAVSTNIVCEGDTVTFTENSGGFFQSYEWDFGPGATPATALGSGPHEVVYNSINQKDVFLTANNGVPTAIESLVIDVNAAADASFTTSVFNTGVISFQPQLTPSNIDSLFWDFDDGTTSDQYNPVHTFATNNSYLVELTVFNSCGSAVQTENVIIQGIDINELSQSTIKLYPQPASNQVTLQYVGEDLNCDMTLYLFDATGKQIQSIEVSSAELKNGFGLALSGLAAGWYQVQMINDSYFWQSPLIKQ